MPKQKIAVTLDAGLVRQLDRLVRRQESANRSNAVEAAVRLYLGDAARRAYERELAKLDAEEEAAFANEGAGDPRDWPAPC